MGLWTSIKNLFSRKKKCTCLQSDTDGKYYCYKQVQGRWEACRGPFDTLQECMDQTGEKCNS